MPSVAFWDFLTSSLGSASSMKSSPFILAFYLKRKQRLQFTCSDNFLSNFSFHFCKVQVCSLGENADGIFGSIKLSDGNARVMHTKKKRSSYSSQILWMMSTSSFELASSRSGNNRSVKLELNEVRKVLGTWTLNNKLSNFLADNKIFLLLGGTKFCWFDTCVWNVCLFYNKS